MIRSQWCHFSLADNRLVDIAAVIGPFVAGLADRRSELTCPFICVETVG
jgi:hypothetical protein